MRTDLRRLHKKWLPSLNMQKITRKDLLTQILVVLTIKKALNGDESTINQLFNIYKKTAKAIAVKLALRRGLKPYSEDIEDIKQEAIILLRYILTGFRAKEILKSIVHRSQSEYLPIPKWIKKFYFYYLCEYVPENLIKAVATGDYVTLATLLDP